MRAVKCHVWSYPTIRKSPSLHAECVCGCLLTNTVQQANILAAQILSWRMIIQAVDDPAVQLFYTCPMDKGSIQWTALKTEEVDL